jgi:hypothetical protein
MGVACLWGVAVGFVWLWLLVGPLVLVLGGGWLPECLAVCAIAEQSLVAY